MTDTIVYRYTRPDGGVSVSPRQPEGEYTILHRLCADESKVLTDGTREVFCTDTETPEVWTEIFTADEISAEDALNIICGGAGT